MNSGSCRIAVVISGGDLFGRKGVVNACINRVKYLKQVSDYDIDVYYLLIESREFRLRNIIKHDGYRRDVVIGDIRIQLLWHILYTSPKFLLGKCIRWYNRVRGMGIRETPWIERLSSIFKNYDLVSAHSSEGAQLGRFVKSKYGIPYFVTWHGSDIHTQPFLEKAWWDDRVQSIESADCNFFVSNTLKVISNSITTKGRKCVLYNGVDSSYRRFNEDEREHLRQKYQVSGTKVVAFAGNLRHIKNVNLLPCLFHEISNKYNGKVCFWVIGDGVLRQMVESEMSHMNIECIFWGNIHPTMMPTMLNCIDALVLPSKNEGMPLIVLEALACGANVVASRVGGIPEALDAEFCIPLDDTFITNFSDKVSEVLRTRPQQLLSDCFDWKKTAIIENSIYREFLTKKQPF